MKAEATTQVATGNVQALPHVPNSQDQLIEVTLALIAIIVLIYGIAWIIKRNRGLVPSAGVPMKTLGVLPMGVKEKIILVEVGDKQLLLGMTQQSINTLATFDDPIIDSSASKDVPFATRLKEILNRSYPNKQNTDATQTDHIHSTSESAGDA